MSKIKPEASRRKKIIKSRNNEIGNIKSRENEQNKGWFFKKINKIDKPLRRKKNFNIENQECKGRHDLRSYRH